MPSIQTIRVELFAGRKGADSTCASRIFFASFDVQQRRRRRVATFPVRVFVIENLLVRPRAAALGGPLHALFGWLTQ
jgi:hypothetical protein